MFEKVPEGFKAKAASHMAAAWLSTISFAFAYQGEKTVARVTRG